MLMLGRYSTAVWPEVRPYDGQALLDMRGSHVNARAADANIFPLLG